MATKIKTESSTTVTPTVTNNTGSTETTTRTKGGKTLTPEQMQHFYDVYDKPLQQQYQIDPNTLKYTGSVGEDIFGFDPKEYIEEEKAKQKAAAFKRKEAGWANALKVVSDIATAAAGGNVYNTPLANVGKEASAQEQQSKDNIRKMGQAVTQAGRGQELAYAKARQEKFKEYYDRYGVQTDTTTKTKTPSTSTTTGGDKYTTSSREVIDNSGNGEGKNDTYQVAVNITHGGRKETKVFDVDKKNVPILKNKIHNAYAKILKSKDDNGQRTKASVDLEKYLIDNGILIGKYADNNNNVPEINDDKMLQTGIYWSLPEDAKKLLMDAINKSGVKYKFADGWGNVEEDVEWK